MPQVELSWCILLLRMDNSTHKWKVEHSRAEKAPAAARISADQKMAVPFQQRELGAMGSAVWVNAHALWSS